MAGLFSHSSLEQVRAASDIVDVIGAVLPLKRAGANFLALCPFHKEKTPSFNVNPQRQIFHCFGCHKGGDVFRFVQEYEGLSFPEAVRRLAERAKIPLEEAADSGQAQSRSLKDLLLGMHEQLTQRWQQALLNDASAQVARDYLDRRGVSSEAIQLFRLGYAPEAWDDTVNWAKSRHYELPLVEKAGLIIRKEGPGEVRYYDRFRGRLMFPICDEQARVIAFSGRILNADEKTAKYVNSPESPIFTKGKVFYGLDKSKRALLDNKFAVVCEGQLDLIACFMGGVQNIVAPQGTAFTSDHARILKRYVDEVVLCFDSDTAGQTAAVRVLDSLVSSGLAIRVVSIPPPHDPDSYIKQFGGPAFHELIRKAQGFFDYYLDRLCATNDIHSDKGQLTVTRAMAEALNKTGSSVLLDTYAQKTALRLSVSHNAVRIAFQKNRAAATRVESVPNEQLAPSAPSAQPPSAVEYWLLKVLLLHLDWTGWVAAHLDPAWISHPTVRQIVELLFRQRPDSDSGGAATLLPELSDEPSRTLVSEILAESRRVRNPEQQLSDIALRLRNQALDREIARLRQLLESPALPESEHAVVMRRHGEVLAAKAQPIAPLHPPREEDEPEQPDLE